MRDPLIRTPDDVFTQTSSLTDHLFAPQQKVSERGVVFFRAQDDLTNDLQKELILRLGALTGRPPTSSLHIHPLDLGGDDPEISTISAPRFAPFDGKTPETGEGVCLKSQNNAQWHADTTFEPVPADYTSLRLTQLPKGGGGM